MQEGSSSSTVLWILGYQNVRVDATLDYVVTFSYILALTYFITRGKTIKRKTK